MLIIFDLDDTLIDTSHSVLPFKLRSCLYTLIDNGLEISNFEEAYAALLHFNTQYRSKEALLKFISEVKAPPPSAARALQELTSPLPNDFFIPTTPKAKEILTWLSSQHLLALVTAGHPPFQREKMEKAGLDSSFFSKIMISEDAIKKPCYQVLEKHFLIPPEQIWVCGDRVAIDLAPAKELGFRTIHMRWGRGIREQSADWIDYSISSLSELKDIIQ